jgi:hypothetical protein
MGYNHYYRFVVIVTFCFILFLPRRRVFSSFFVAGEVIFPEYENKASKIREKWILKGGRLCGRTFRSACRAIETE